MHPVGASGESLARLTDGETQLEQSTHGYQNRSATITVIMVGDIRRQTRTSQKAAMTYV